MGSAGHQMVNLLFVLTILVKEVISQRLALGPCQDVTQLTSFHVSQFVGDWYEIERSFYLVESTLSCTRLNFSLKTDNDNNPKLMVRVAFKLPWRSDMSSVLYSSEVPGGNGTMELVLKDVPQSLSRIAPGSGTYTVLDTDYTDYALIYSCTNLRFFHADFVWILGRTVDISASVRSRVYASLDAQAVNRDRLLLTKHDC